MAGLLEGVHQFGVTRGQRIDAGFELMYITSTAGAALSYCVLQLLTKNRRLPAQLLKLGRILARQLGVLCLAHVALLSRTRELVRRIPQRYRPNLDHVRSGNFDTLATLLIFLTSRVEREDSRDCKTASHGHCRRRHRRRRRRRCDIGCI
ncbi:hypothetical protein MHPYR_10002 [uncultured Mycobacterium sp.]|uniref:Uncharacterized protein n=1 Tax=uncultured Mycobacterium sp. TaxID=171292 RepID=A0A1Y5NUN5_9MYCO|nr:hypothetical protein MHPYR_10002 [uncultured Mycobacterium sp.]